MSESLKSNATLNALYLFSEDKRKKTRQKDIHKQITLFVLFVSIENYIGDTGATSLSEALKSNTTLITLDLNRESKKMTKRCPSSKHTFPFVSFSQ